MPNPYRVLAFAVECGDHRLADLLARRLFARPPHRVPAALRALESAAAALQLG